MATIIDALVVELDLDPKKFTQGQKDAVESLRKLEDGATKHVKSTKSEFDKLLDTFKAVQGRLLAIGALVASGIGFESFTAKVARANAQTGMLADSLGVSTKELSAWKEVAGTVGAQADDIAANFQKIRDAQSGAQTVGGNQLMAFSYATKMQGNGPGVDLTNPDGTKRSPTDILVDMSRWYTAQKDRANASYILRNTAGMSQGMVNLLSVGPEELKKRFERAEKFAPDDDQKRKFEALTKAFGDLMEVVDKLAIDLAAKLTPSLLKILQMITDWLERLERGGGHNLANNGAEIFSQAYGVAPPKPGLVTRGWNWLTGKGSGDSSADNDNAPQGTDGAENRASSGGASWLAQQRSQFAKELQDPDTRRLLGAIISAENPGAGPAVAESLMNRTMMVNQDRANRGLPPLTLREMIVGTPSIAHGQSFYGPVRNGAIMDHLRRVTNDPAYAARMNGYIDRALAGSNLVQGNTDQGSYGDPNYFAGGTGVNINRERFNDWGYPGSRAFRENFMAQYNAAGTSSASAQKLPSSESSSPAQTLALSGTSKAFPSWLPGMAANADGATPTFSDRWNSRIGLGARGALVRGGDTTTNNNSSSNTSIGNMNVTVPQGADPAAYARGIQQELQRYGVVGQTNTGMF